MEIKEGKVLYKGLIKGRLIKRYKRFLADVKLETGEIVTAHCANSGSMKECIKEDALVYLSPQNRPERKLKFTWEMIEMPTSLVGVNTGVPNKLVVSSIESGKIAELTGYDKVKPEIKTSDGTRLDILLEKENKEKCYVEIKNSTMVEKRHGFFPDAVTTRGQKHLLELEELVKKGHRGVVFFLIQRMDVDVFSPADHIDEEYGRLLRQVNKNGVEILAYDTILTADSITINKRVEVKL